MNYLIEYRNAVYKGDVIIGHELEQVLDSLIADLKDRRFVFDEKPGQLRIDFIERFCKHTKSPFNGIDRKSVV